MACCKARWPTWCATSPLPHFWALAIHRKEEYAKADIPMLPVTHGEHYTKVHILLFHMIAVLMIQGSYTYARALQVFSLVVFSITFASQMLAFLTSRVLHSVPSLASFDLSQLTSSPTPTHPPFPRLPNPPVPTVAKAKRAALDFARLVALKQRGFKFVGPVITYAFLQAVGIVNDHTSDCFRRDAAPQPTR